MGDLTKNFSRREFACKCKCGFNDIDLGLVDQLQMIRDILSYKAGIEVPISINSGCRCVSWNAKIGGVKNSFHVKGLAADISLGSFDVKEAAPIIQKAYFLHKIELGAIGVYPDRNFMHVDVRDTVELVTWINIADQYEFGVDFAKSFSEKKG